MWQSVIMLYWYHITVKPTLYNHWSLSWAIYCHLWTNLVACRGFFTVLTTRRTWPMTTIMRQNMSFLLMCGGGGGSGGRPFLLQAMLSQWFWIFSGENWVHFCIFMPFTGTQSIHSALTVIQTGMITSNIHQ